MIEDEAVTGVRGSVGQNLSVIIHNGLQVIRERDGLLVSMNIHNILERNFASELSLQWRANSNNHLSRAHE